MPNPVINRRVSESPYVFSNAQAKAYWNALTSANGSEVQGAIYGITTNNLKRAIDVFFITGSASGWLSKMTGMYLYIGGSSNTHAVNAINPGTFNLTFVGSPTHSKSGFGALNGTTQYARTGIIPSTHLTTNNVHLSAYSKTNNTASSACYIGSRNSVVTQRVDILYTIASSFNTFRSYDSSASSRADGTINATDKFIVGSRLTSTDTKLYINGVQDGANTNVSGSVPNVEIYLGADNNAGAADLFSNYLYHFHSVGLGLSSAEQLSLYNADVVLNQTLGR